jgi:outer membrane protein OmpA-like peptidoglycan-associated protein
MVLPVVACLAILTACAPPSGPAAAPTAAPTAAPAPPAGPTPAAVPSGPADMATYCETFRALSDQSPEECAAAASGPGQPTMGIHEPVDPLGPRTINFPNIRLEPNMQELTPQSKSTLDDVAAVLQHPRMGNRSFLIGGHTAEVGGEREQQAYAQQLAMVTKAYLVSQHGIPADRLSVQGFGAGRPLRPDDDDVNSRVSITVTGD